MMFVVENNKAYGFRRLDLLSPIALCISVLFFYNKTDRTYQELGHLHNNIDALTPIYQLLHFPVNENRCLNSY